jgi:hypothetical protein
MNKLLELISKEKRTTILLEFSIKAFKKWKQINQPEWAYLKFPQIDFQM